jgi:hypothetical protein
MQYSMIVCMVCVVLAVLMLGAVMVKNYWFAEPQDTTVERVCWVYTTHDTSTIFEDEDGNLWEIDARFTLVDEPYLFTFDTQGTEDLTDDVVTGITLAR